MNLAVDDQQLGTAAGWWSSCSLFSGRFHSLLAVDEQLVRRLLLVPLPCMKKTNEKKLKKSRNWASKNQNCDRTEYSLQTEAPGHDTISPSLQRMEAGAHISRPLIVTFLPWNQLFAPPASHHTSFLPFFLPFPGQ